MSSATWPDYLGEYHDSRPGITEVGFARASHPDVGTPYDWLVQCLPGPLGDVLDLACGNAAVQPRLAPYASYLGVDRSSGELEQARRRGRGPVLEGDLRDLPLEDACVDVVVSSMGLMLVQPVEQALAEVHRVLRPSGRLALLLPAPWPLHLRDLPVLLRLSRSLRGPGSMPQQLGRRRIRQALEAAGLPVLALDNRRFPFVVSDDDSARLAVRALYTPGRTPEQLAAAERLLLRRGTVTLPVPLLRVLAERPVTAA
jgi:SAM-dependent methyltransferase